MPVLLMSYLGMSYLAWAWIAWGGVFGTFCTVMIYRTLISARKQDELFIPPQEMRRNRAHLRDVDRMAVLFGAASAAMLVAIAAVAVFGR